MSLYMAEAELLAELELAVQLGVVLMQVLQEGVWSWGQQGWMRKIGVDHKKPKGEDEPQDDPESDFGPDPTSFFIRHSRAVTLVS